MKKILSSIVLSFVLSLSAYANRDWKSVFISGDDSIPNFDNGRKALASMLAPLGAHAEFQNHLSSEAKEVKGKVLLATAENITKTFKNLKIDKTKDGCLVFMTSHGAKGQGFYLSKVGIMSPALFAQMVNEKCGEVPTVVLVSACYSGQFIIPALATKNRVILTAARPDRPSFGCSVDTTYTYWDECLLENIPSSNTWQELYSDVRQCIEQKEAILGVKPSEPQAFFGEAVKNLPILNK